jgi:hypothetical protein
MARTREEMRLYQRARRARIKAEDATVDRDWAVVDGSLPRNAITSASDAEHERIRAKAAAIGRGKAVITQTNGRLDVVSRDVFDARLVAPSPSRAVATPPPPSMVAIGGQAGRGLVAQGNGYAAPPNLAAVSPFTRAEEFRAQTTAMLAALAAKSDAQERRIVALEAADADRRARKHELAQAVFGLFGFAAR